MADVIFKKGLSTNLPEQISEGQILVETDTGVVHVDVAADKRLNLTSFGYGVMEGTEWTLSTVEVPGIKNQDGCAFIVKSRWIPPNGMYLSVNGQPQKRMALRGSFAIGGDDIKADTYWLVVYDSSLDDGNGAWNFLFTTPALLNAGEGLSIDPLRTTYSLGTSGSLGLFSDDVTGWYNILRIGVNSHDYVMSGLLTISRTGEKWGSPNANLSPDGCTLLVQCNKPREGEDMVFKVRTIETTMEPFEVRMAYLDTTKSSNLSNNYRGPDQVLMFDAELQEQGNYTIKYVSLSTNTSTIEIPLLQSSRYSQYIAGDWYSISNISENQVIKPESNGIEWEEI